MFFAQVVTVSCLLLQCRAMLKTHKLPSITNSLVNMGKIDISVYMSPPNDFKKQEDYKEAAFFRDLTKLDLEDACPCTKMKHFMKSPQSSLSNPSNFLNKLLLSNDLFTFHKEPVSSGLCCDAPIHSNDNDLLWFELAGLSPKEMDLNGMSKLPQMLFDLEPKHLVPKHLVPKHFVPKRTKTPKVQEIKIKKKDMSATMKNEEIKRVGDKDFRNTFVNVENRKEVTTKEAVTTKINNLGEVVNTIPNE